MTGILGLVLRLFQPYSWGLLQSGENFKILLFVDIIPCYPRLVNEALKEIQIVFLPAKASSLLQPVDQSVILTWILLPKMNFHYG